VFENRAMKKILGPRNDQLIVNWLYKEKLHNFYFPRRIIEVIQSRRMRWARQVAQRVLSRKT
jgi:hypothetical protein